MPIPDHAFAHVPHLKDKIIDPERSFYRVTRETFWSADKITDNAATLANHLLTHEQRDASRAMTLAGRPHGDLWLFAYGSLIWDPAVTFEEVRLAGLDGFHRSFCLWLHVGRGTEGTPSLMLNLDHGGEARGLAFRIPAAQVAHETEVLWQREMFVEGYRPRFVEAATPQGPVEALTFTIDRKSRRYAGGMDLERTARVIAAGGGPLGTNLDYLENLITHLKLVRIEDEAMARLLARTREIAAKP